MNNKFDMSGSSEDIKHRRLQYQANQLVIALVNLEKTKVRVARQYTEFNAVCRQNQEEPASYIERATVAYGGVLGRSSR